MLGSDGGAASHLPWHFIITWKLSGGVNGGNNNWQPLGTKIGQHGHGRTFAAGDDGNGSF